jgi:nuclear GTP-binding protein
MKPRHGQDSNRKSETSMSAGEKAGSAVRSKQTVNRLNMYKSKGLKWVHGKLTGKGLVTDAVAQNKAARVQPDRRWFGNTRVVGQKELSNFREEIAAKTHDPYTVLLKRKQLPMGLLTDATKMKQMNLLEVESYSDTFGGSSKRKRPKIGGTSSLEELVQKAQTKVETYDPAKDINVNLVGHRPEGIRDAKNDQHIFEKGQVSCCSAAAMHQPPRTDSWG